MSVGLRNSTIETFRKRYHGNNVLKSYRLNNDGQGLSLIRVLTNGFFLGRNSDTTFGAVPYLLTIDALYTEGMQEFEVTGISYFDLVNPDTGIFKRYKVSTDATPQVDDNRYVLEILAAFNNALIVL